MSRHDVPCLLVGHTAVVGWHPPLQTFFGQVRRVDDLAGEDADIDPVVHWIGAGPQVVDLTGLAEGMKGFAELDGELLARLERDRELDR